MAITIKFNSSTGSDTAASGAGPSTALTGTNASYSGSVFTLDGSPDLSGVVVADSILWVDTSTGRQFFDISSVDNGADTVTVVTAPAGTSTGLTWAIGGKRATFDDADSRKAFVDAKAQWIIEAEDDGAATLSSALTISGFATFSTGTILVRGMVGAKRVCNQTANATNFHISGLHVKVKNFKFTNSNGVSKTAARGIVYASGNRTYVEDCIFGDATNTLLNCVANNTNSSISLTNCEFRCTGDAILSTSGNMLVVEAEGCTFHAVGGIAINMNLATANTALFARRNLIYDITGDAITLPQNLNEYRLVLDGNTIDDIGGDGVDAAFAWGTGAVIRNNILSNITGTALKFAADVDRTVNIADFNNFYNNGTNRSNISAGANDQASDPQYVSAATGDYRIGTNLKGLGWPTTFPG